MADWNAGEYDRFAGPRQRAAVDLLKAIGKTAVARVTDLGCGSGLSTELLAQRWPDARITGVDNSPAMLDKARQRLPTAHFMSGDIASFSGDAPQDLIFANASLHWIPDHHTLLPRLVAQLAPGGVLAFQMPDNLGEPSHRLMESLTREAEFASYFENSTGRRAALLTEVQYYNLLAASCEHIDIWQTRYLHVLENVEAIADWFATTGMKPYLDRLPESLRVAYRSRYVEELRKAYKPTSDGQVLLAMPRVFIVATRKAAVS